MSRQDVIKTGGPLTARIEVTRCDGYGSGTGFVIGPNLVATVASVVDNADSIAVRGAEVGSATVIGTDQDRQVALLRTSVAMSSGASLEFAAEEPAEGDEVVAITYPGGRPQTSITGTINGLNRSVDLDNERLSGLIQYNSGADADSSGGPLLNSHGQVVGLTEGRYGDSGETGYAISTSSARGLVEAWKAAPAEIKAPVCKSRPRTVVKVESEQPDAPGLAYFVRSHFDGLNAGDDTMSSGANEGLSGYDASFGVLSGRLREQLGPIDRFRDNRLTARNSNVVMSNVQKLDDVQDTVDIAFNRTTGPKSARKCGRYAYRYTARLASGTWTLDSRVPTGKNPDAC